MWILFLTHVHFGGFEWHSPHFLGDLNICSTLSDAVWGSFGGVALQKEMHHWASALRSESLLSPPVCAFCPLLAIQEMSSQLFLSPFLDWYPWPYCNAEGITTLELCAQVSGFHPMVFYHSSWEVTMEWSR